MSFRMNVPLKRGSSNPSNDSVRLEAMTPDATECECDPGHIDDDADQLPHEPHVLPHLDGFEVEVGPNEIADDIADSHVNECTQEPTKTQLGGYTLATRDRPTCQVQ